MVLLWRTVVHVVAFAPLVLCRTSFESRWSLPSNGLENSAMVHLQDVHSKEENPEVTDRQRSPNSSTFYIKRVMVVRVSLNLTFYIELEPQRDTTLHSRLDHVSVHHDSGSETHPVHDLQSCQFIGRVISPVTGVASVNTCSNSSEIYAIMITDGGMFYLRPRMIEWRGEKDRPHVFTRLPANGDSHFCGLHTLNEEVALDDMNRVAPPTTTEAPLHVDSEHENIVIHARRRRRRRRRAADGGIKYIETGIFVDRHMYDAVEKMKPPNTVAAIVNVVMAILHQVQLIYEYQSMKAYDFKLIVVKFEILRNTKTSPNTGGGNIDRYLDNFCAWQCKRLPSVGSKDHWDHAIMLTGLDMFKMSGNVKNDKVLGLAWVNGMCQCAYSCTINEGNSAEAAFVIAHEMGHSLGMQHDGSGNSCDSNKYIMSDRTGAGKVNWSKCSNDYVKQAERKGQYRCLANEAKPASPAVDIKKLAQLPGEEYPAMQQCQMALSPKHKPYTKSSAPFNDVCRELWCLEGQWATPAHPALDGTSCGSGKWCRQGACVVKNSDSKLNVPPPAESTERPQTAATQSEQTSTTARRVTGQGAPPPPQRRRWAFRNLYGRYSGIFG